MKKKHVVKLYCFVAHAQHNTTRIDRELGKKANNMLGKKANNTRVAGLNVTENQQDRDDSGRDLESECRKEHEQGELEKERARTLEAVTERRQRQDASFEPRLSFMGKRA